VCCGEGANNMVDHSLGVVGTGNCNGFLRELV
jgi:hypothetical protein